MDRVNHILKYNITYFTDVNGNVEDFVVTKDPRNSSRLPAYHRLDVSASYNFSIGKVIGQIGLSIFNVYGRENVKTRKLSIPFLERTLQTPNQPVPEYRDLHSDRIYTHVLPERWILRFLPKNPRIPFFSPFLKKFLRPQVG